MEMDSCSESCQHARVCLESDFRQCRVEWLKEHLQLANGTRIECAEIKQQLHQAFGYTSDPELGHSIKDAFPDVRHKRIRVGGKQKYFYCGIQWMEFAAHSAVPQDPHVEETENTVAEGSIMMEQSQNHDNHCVEDRKSTSAASCGSSANMESSPHSYLPPFADSPESVRSAGIPSTRNTTTTLEGQKCYIPDYGMSTLRMRNLQRKVRVLHGQVQTFFDNTTTCIIIDKLALSKGLMLGETVDDLMDKLREKNVPVIDVADLSPIRRLEFD